MCHFQAVAMSIQRSTEKDRLEVYNEKGKNPSPSFLLLSKIVADDPRLTTITGESQA